MFERENFGCRDIWYCGQHEVLSTVIGGGHHREDDIGADLTLVKN
jgi:hypothetical protein